MSDGSDPSIPYSESGAQDELVGKEVVIQGIKNKKRTDLNGKRALVEALGTGERTLPGQEPITRRLKELPSRWFPVCTW